MIKVKSRGNETAEQMLRRFKKMCEKEGLTKDIKRSWPITRNPAKSAGGAIARWVDHVRFANSCFASTFASTPAGPLEPIILAMIGFFASYVAAPGYDIEQ